MADHVDRRRLLEITTVGLIGTSALFWLQAALDWNNVWVLLCVFSLQQAFFAVNQPTRTAILPKLVPDEQLPAANTLNMTVMSAGAIAGPLVGGEREREARAGAAFGVGGHHLPEWAQGPAGQFHG